MRAKVAHTDSDGTSHVWLYMDDPKGATGTFCLNQRLVDMGFAIYMENGRYKGHKSSVWSFCVEPYWKDACVPDVCPDCEQ